MTKYIFGERCDHGQLKRSCELCELQDANGLLKEQVADLECCGNCMFLHNCQAITYASRQAGANHFCDKWKSDTLTREKRKIK
jgi:hypothetical protein